MRIHSNKHESKDKQEKNQDRQQASQQQQKIGSGLRRKEIKESHTAKAPFVEKEIAADHRPFFALQKGPIPFVLLIS